jgi:putative transcriptional regulator
MAIVRMKIDMKTLATAKIGRIDQAKVDATTEEEIEQHRLEDAAEARMDAARYARRVRQRFGMSQSEFARRINVSLVTVRNWEQGKRSPTGAARALLRILDRAPTEVLFSVL